MLLTAAVLACMLFAFVYQRTQVPQTLHAAQAQEKNIQNHLSVQGTLSAARQSQIAAAKGGLVAEVYIEAGETVTVGSPLVRLAPAEETTQDLSKLFSVMQEQGFTPHTQDGIVLYADMDGTITQCPAMGEFLYPAQVAVTISDLSSIQIVTEVPELYANTLQLGQTAVATPIYAEEVQYHGILTNIASQVSEKTNFLSQSTERVLECVLQLDPQAELPRLGTTMEVTICTDSIARAVTVPHTAIRQEGEAEYICVVSEDGIESRWIETGYQLSSEIQVKSGIQAGEWVLEDEQLPEVFPNGVVVMAE